MRNQSIRTTAVRTTCGLITLDERKSAILDRPLRPGECGGAKIYPFPLHRRVDLVRSSAAMLATRDYAAGHRFWSSHVRQVRAELKRRGLTGSALDIEIRRYAAA